MGRTRHAIEALHMARASRRPFRPREPNGVDIALGLTAFIAVVAFLLFLAATIGG